MNPDGRALRPLLAAAAGLISVQTGAAFAKSLFVSLGPEGVAALRLGFAAAILAVTLRPWRNWGHGPSGRALLGYGVMLGAMNLLIYYAFAYIPVSIAVSIEVLGPLGVALVHSRQRIDLVWIALALLGMVLLPLGAFHGSLDPRGIAFALAAALAWGLYIVTGSRVAAGGKQSVATGMLVAALINVPNGIWHAGAALLTPGALAIGLLVALLSSTIPYLLDMYAMRHLPARVFGVLMSASPAIAALAGWLVLREALSLVQAIGIAAIMAACAGSALFSRRT